MSIKIFNIVKSLYIFKFVKFNMNHKIDEKHETHYAPIMSFSRIYKHLTN